MATNYDGLPLNLEDAEVKIMVDASIEWMKANTDLEIPEDEELTASEKLFVTKYCGVIANAGVTSESLGGMSQSFDKGVSELLMEIAGQLFGSHFKGRCRFVAAIHRWK